MRKQGKLNPGWGSGYQKPSDGWHLCEFGDEFRDMMNRDGEIVTDKKGMRRWIIPAIIKDDEDEGKNADIIISYGSDYGEQVLADILLATGLEKKFEKNFPGDISIWDKEVINEFMKRVPGTVARLKTEMSKDGKYCNVIDIEPASASTPDKAPKKEAPSKATGNWDDD